MMDSESREQLLSAYLDGELSADERAQVESWLAADPSYRALRDGMLSTRAAIQSLPRHRLDHDLSAAVLRRAERTVLEGRAGAHEPSATPGSRLRRWFSSGRSWRMLVWPAAAVAAALLVAFLSRDEQGQRQVALQAPRGPASIQESKDTRAPSDEGVKPQLARQAEPAEPAMTPLREPQAAAGAAAPMAAPAEQGRYSAKPMRKEKEAAGLVSPSAPEVVELEVDREFIRTHALELWLDAHKIAWRRLPQQAKRAGEVDEELPTEDSAGAATDGDLEVQITADQLADLKTEVGRHRASNLAAARNAPQRAGEVRESASPGAEANASGSQRPLIIRLKVAAAAPTDEGQAP